MAQPFACSLALQKLASALICCAALLAARLHPWSIVLAGHHHKAKARQGQESPFGTQAGIQGR